MPVLSRSNKAGTSRDYMEGTMKQFGGSLSIGAAFLVLTTGACSGSKAGPMEGPPAAVGTETGGTAPPPNEGGSQATAPKAGTSGTPTPSATGGTGVTAASGRSGAVSGSGGAGAGSGSPAMMTAPEEKLDPSVDWTALTIVSPKMYSAHDGTHTFQVPMHVDGATVELAGWQAIPSNAVTIEPDAKGAGVLITIRKPIADITIAAHSAAIGGTAHIYVTAATPEDWKVGEARYNNGVDYTIPALDFAQLVDPNWMPPPTPKNLACNNCHTTGAKYFEIQHTPTQIGNISDQDLITIFTTGMKPPGVPYHLLPMQLQRLYPEFHTWEAGPAEQKGLIVYLRSLTPTDQGKINLQDSGIVLPDAGMLPDGGVPPRP
jgi:hypothetical protein